MEKFKNSIMATMLVCFLLLFNAITTFATPENVKVIKGSGNWAEVEEAAGGHYYAFSGFDRRYSKISATIQIPGPEHLILEGSHGKRAAYISFGVKGNHGIDFGLTRATGSDEYNNWHVYAYNTVTGKFARWTDYTYTGSEVMTLETTIGADGQTDVVLTVGNDRFNADDKGLLTDDSFIEWRGLSDNLFYRFVSLVDVSGSESIYDGTMLRGVGLQNLSIYKQNVNSNGYPYGSPIKKSWGYKASTILNAYEVYPEQIGVHKGSFSSEYINIKHEVNPEV